MNGTILGDGYRPNQLHDVCSRVHLIIKLVGFLSHRPILADEQSGFLRHPSYPNEAKIANFEAFEPSGGLRTVVDPRIWTVF
jgi:hypothetical protein